MRERTHRVEEFLRKLGIWVVPETLRRAAKRPQTRSGWASYGRGGVRILPTALRTKYTSQEETVHLVVRQKNCLIDSKFRPFPFPHPALGERMISANRGPLPGVPAVEHLADA